MLQTEPLSPRFGLETFDIDVSKPLSDAAFEEIERTFFQGQALVLRGEPGIGLLEEAGNDAGYAVGPAGPLQFAQRLQRGDVDGLLHITV